MMDIRIAMVGDGGTKWSRLDVDSEDNKEEEK